MNDLVIATLLTQVAAGGATGFMVGYGLRKLAGLVLKVAAVAVALFTIPLAALASVGVLKVDWEALTLLIGRGFSRLTELIIMISPSLMQALPATGSFGLGVIAGAMKG